MSRGVYVRAILDFNCLSNAFHQAPKLALDIIFSDRLLRVVYWIKMRLVSEVVLLEVIGSLLELFQGVDAALLKAELACADKAFGTMPVILGYRLERRFKAIAMVAAVTAVAKQNGRRVVRLSTRFAPLLYSQN